MPMRWTPENDQLLLLKILETHDIRLDPKKVAEVWPTIEGQDKPTPRAITERLVRMRAMVKPGNSNSVSMIGSGPGPSNGSPTSKRGRKPGYSNSTPRSGQRKKAADSSGNGKDAPTQSSPLKSEMELYDDNAIGSADAEHELDTDFVTGEAEDITIETPTKKRKARGLFNIPAFTAAPSTPASTPAVAAAGVMGSRQTQEGPDVRAGSSLGLNIKEGAHQWLGAVGDGSPVKRTPRARRATTKIGMVSYADHLDDDEDGLKGGMDEVDSSASDYVPDSAVFDDDDFA
ncbi:hypothetical protein BDV10DRAFT_184438 [Aspergillus recurvatus]